MATTLSITTTYAGESAKKFVAAALLSAPTIENGGVEIMGNVKYRSVIQKISTDGLLKNSTCDFDAQSTVTLTERILEVKDLQVNLQLCKKTFHNTFLGIEQGYSSFDTLPTSFQDYLLGYVASKVAAQNEVAIWNGATGTGGQFDGFVTKISTDAGLPTAQEIAATSTNITAASTVITELGKIVDAIPATLYGKEDLYLYVSQATARAYVRALGGFGASGLGSNGTNAMGTQWYNNGSLTFDGVKIFVANGLNATQAVATTKSNLFFGTSLESDLIEASVIDMSPLDGSQNVRIIMRMAAGVQYGAIEDIVTYGITNSAN
jgi:hypothetical protein